MLCSRVVASRYDRYMADVWRGDDRSADAFAAWLAPFWVAGEPFPPRSASDAHSALGGVGRGIDWYDEDDIVIGVVPGWAGAGCYRIPRTARLPAPVEPLEPHQFTASPPRRHPALRPRRLSAPPWTARRYRPRGY